MSLVQLHGTDIRVPRLGFGSASLHHLPSRGERQRLLAEAFQLGFRYFDTAPYYGHGMAERALGELARGRRDQVVIATKYGLSGSRLMRALPALMYLRLAAHSATHRFLGYDGIAYRPRRNFSAAAATISLERSLQTMRTDFVDVLLLHEPTLAELPDADELIGALERLQQAGKVRYLGISGEAKDCGPILRRFPLLGQVVHVNAAPGPEGLEQMRTDGLPCHVSFGHFRGRSGTIRELLDAAVRSHPDGVILYSTRALPHLRETATAAAALGVFAP